MIKMIANVCANGVIGVNGDLAVKYPEDMKHFKRSTFNSIVIMGRNTFESMGSKPLPSRMNFIVSSTLENNINNVKVFKTLSEAITASEDDCWIIGGSALYQEGMLYADSIHLTLSPDIIDTKNNKVNYFPWINPNYFYQGFYKTMETDHRLHECVYFRRT